LTDDEWRGQFDTQALRVEDARVISKREARGRRLDDANPADRAVVELLNRLTQPAETYCRSKSKEVDHVKKIAIPLIAFVGTPRSVNDLGAVVASAAPTQRGLLDRSIPNGQ
jgi:hypothetical protein